MPKHAKTKNEATKLDFAQELHRNEAQASQGSHVLTAIAALEPQTPTLPLRFSTFESQLQFEDARVLKQSNV